MTCFVQFRIRRQPLQLPLSMHLSRVLVRGWDSRGSMWEHKHSKAQLDYALCYARGNVAVRRWVEGVSRAPRQCVADYHVC